mmetsp:Transcript_62129/g.148182  ORF Transcript_62129/g.148182 Transcript_62129/m.148182 type:complete len:248 (+) Transcript_62129:840-1583(+)
MDKSRWSRFSKGIRLRVCRACHPQIWCLHSQEIARRALLPLRVCSGIQAMAAPTRGLVVLYPRGFHRKRGGAQASLRKAGRGRRQQPSHLEHCKRSLWAASARAHELGLPVLPRSNSHQWSGKAHQADSLPLVHEHHLAPIGRLQLIPKHFQSGLWLSMKRVDYGSPDKCWHSMLTLVCTIWMVVGKFPAGSCDTRSLRTAADQSVRAQESGIRPTTPLSSLRPSSELHQTIGISLRMKDCDPSGKQ